MNKVIFILRVTDALFDGEFKEIIVIYSQNYEFIFYDVH